MQEQIQQLAAKIRQRAGDTGQQFVANFETGNANLVDEWVAIFLAIETLEDATEALAYYEEHGVGGEIGERYVRIYGMFQAAILQQQAITRLYEVFVGSRMAIPRGSGWRKISKVYQLAIGSPLEGWRPNSAQSKLSQIRITDDGFYIVTWDRDAWEQSQGEVTPERIEPMELLSQYTQEAAACLKEVCEAMSTTSR